MRKTFKFIIISILIVISSLLFVYKSSYFQNREIIFNKTLGVTEHAKDFHLSTNGIIIFDGETLFLCDKNGNLIKKVNSKNGKLEVFFINKYAILYDRDLKKLYQYQDNGELLNTIKLKEDLYNITYKNKNIILHTKSEEGESLYELKSDGSLNNIYNTASYIIAYDIYELPNKFSIAELKSDANGYKTILVRVNNEDKKVNENSSEVALYINRYKNRTIMATDKKLYIYDGEKKISKEIPNISDIMILDRNIYLLHSDIISKYNMKLEELDKLILAANVEKMFAVSNSVYAYGDNNIGAELGRGSQFYTRFGSSVEKVDSIGVTIGTLKEGKINLYKIVSKNATRN
ncbi:MAG: hypothetical protein ACTJGH_04720 [Peptoniphilaceae bacterium]